MFQYLSYCSLTLRLAVLKQLIALSGKKLKVGVRYPVSAFKWKAKIPQDMENLKQTS
jgi:hypothetical protein